jgi:hypothetical protein
MRFPLCVGCMCDGTMFSFVCALPSPDSAEGCPPLFAWFTGTTAQSDFSSTCVSAVRLVAFADERRRITFMGRITDAIVSYAAESASASKRQSQQGTCLAKVEPRAPRHKLRRVAIADVAEKIRFHMPFREKLLLAGLTFASRKEFLIEFCVIKT